jgi:parallel beta-helix repeat protein
MRDSILAFFVIALIFIICVPGTALGTTYYVPDDFATIQAALNSVAGGGLHTIVVRDDTYTGTGNKNLDFGGKAVTLRSESGPDNCIIDCEEDGRGFYFHNGETSASILEGFTILNGSADVAGGIQCTSASSPTIRNCFIIGNTAGSGGGLYCYASSNPTVSDCIISGNTAGNAGGIYCYDSSPTITNCLITGNSAQDSLYENGGGIWCVSSSPTISNCTISDNSALDDGGGIWCASSSPTVTNCILWGDSASLGPEIALFADSTLTVSYSDVEGGQAAAHVGVGCTLNWGAGNGDDGPLFANGPLGNYYLGQIAAGQGADSPCLDAGNDTAANLGLHLYATRTTHIGDVGIVDMGFHYGLLTSIQLESPSHLSTVANPPAFSWKANGATNNAFAVDVALSTSGPIYSTYETLHQLIYENSWTMPIPIWNKIPSGTRIYWRVRGADVDRFPLSIITSDQVWSFVKD